MTVRKHSPRRRHNPLPQTRHQQGVRLKKQQQQLGSLIIAIDTAMRKVNGGIDRAIELAQPRGSGSIVGSLVQIPRSDPQHETAFEWLDSVRTALEELVRTSP